jgi:hypothetical protein
MFKKIFLTGLVATVFGTLISLAYFMIFKYSPLQLDFTEKASFVNLLAFNMFIGMATCVLYFILHSIIKKETIVSFVFGLLLSGSAISIALLFLFKVDKDLVFKDENAELYKDFYYFIYAIVTFFPVLSWFTFKPLFIKSK